MSQIHYLDAMDSFIESIERALEKDSKLKKFIDAKPTFIFSETFFEQLEHDMKSKIDWTPDTQEEATRGSE